MSKISERLRNTILKGALFIAPLWLSIVLVGMGYNLIESIFGGPTAAVVHLLIPESWLPARYADGHIPGLSVLVALLLFAGLGALASWRFGARGLKLFDSVFLSLPVLRSVYSAARKMLDTFGESGKTSFRKVVLIELAAGVQTVGLVTNEIEESAGKAKRYVVFVPAMPNPTSGFVIVLPQDRVVETDMSPEEALKFGMSLGVLLPPALT